MKIMAVMRDVRKKSETVSELFGPLKDCLHLLKSHGVDVGSATSSSGGEGGTGGPAIDGANLQDFLEEAPLVWESVMKKTYQKKLRKQ